MIVASPSSLYSDLDVRVELNAPLAERTWYRAGGCADALVHPRSMEALATLLRRTHRDGIPVRILGSGANLLVDDDGVDGIVIQLDDAFFERVQFNADGRQELMRVWGGAGMEPIVMENARRGLAGVEQMAGIPASLGGAVRMNAGGKFGAIGDSVEAVAIVTPSGEERVFTANELRFGYRETNIPAGVVVWAALRVREEDPVACRNRVKEIFRYKKSTQPMSALSAGCMFRNPTLADGTRESAGRLIDLAGLKGLRVGRAFVSEEHGNFLAFDRPTAGARACTDDMRRLVALVRERVLASRGIELETEVVFWRRGESAEGGALE